MDRKNADKLVRKAQSAAKAGEKKEAEETLKLVGKYYFESLSPEGQKIYNAAKNKLKNGTLSTEELRKICDAIASAQDKNQDVDAKANQLAQAVFDALYDGTLTDAQKVSVALERSKAWYNYCLSNQKHLTGSALSAFIRARGVSGDERINICVGLVETNQKNTIVDGVLLWTLENMKAEFISGPFGGYNTIRNLVDGQRYSLYELEVFLRYYANDAKMGISLSGDLETLRTYYSYMEQVRNDPVGKVITMTILGVALSFTVLDKFADVYELIRALASGNSTDAYVAGFGLLPFGDLIQLLRKGKPVVAAIDGVDVVFDGLDDVVEVAETGHDVGKILDEVLRATHNADAPRVVLGKFSEGIDSYDVIAEQLGATYYSMPAERFAELSRELGESEMIKINKEFVRQQWVAGKEILLSHDPYERGTGYFQEELLYLIDLGAKEFEEVVVDGITIWKVVR